MCVYRMLASMHVAMLCALCFGTNSTLSAFTTHDIAKGSAVCDASPGFQFRARELVADVDPRVFLISLSVQPLWLPLLFRLRCRRAWPRRSRGTGPPWSGSPGSTGPSAARRARPGSPTTGTSSSGSRTTRPGSSCSRACRTGHADTCCSSTPPAWYVCCPSWSAWKEENLHVWEQRPVMCGDGDYHAFV